MIEKMKKVSFFIYHSDKERFLSRLQKIGMVHIDKISAGTDPVTEGSEKRLELLVRELKFLDGLDSGKGRLPQTQNKKLPDWDQILADLDKDRKEQVHLSERCVELKNEIAKVVPWGEIDREVTAKLQEAGVQIKLYSVTRSQYIRMDLSGFPCGVVSEDKENIYLIAVYPKGEKPRAIEAREESIPRASLIYLRNELADTEAAERNLRKKIFGYLQYRDGLKKEILQSRNHWIWNRTNSDLRLEADGTLYVATGWVPVRALREVKEFLDRENAAYIVEEPEESDQVPVSLKNNPFARLFEPILKIFSLPSYAELDTTPLFAPFYMLFFGLCVADVGYGIILLIAALGLLVFVKNKTMRPLAFLGVFLAMSVTLSGLLLDDFFGMHILEMDALPRWIKSAVLFPTRADAMSLAILLGVVQIVFGFLVRVVNQVHKHGILGALMPIGTISMLSGSVMLMVNSLAKGLTIGPIPVYHLISSIPNVGTLSLVIIFGGVGLVLLFNGLEHKMKFFLRPLLGLWELYGLLTGLPGDILSYLRLFALGLAGGLLGHAVLNIAMLMKGDSIGSMIGMTLVLVIGNALNLAIGLLSAFVHSLRLTFVEFYKSVGFVGGGKAYEPFKLNSDV